MSKSSAKAKATYQRRDELVRLLNLLPYFSAHPGRSIMQAAADLDADPQQIDHDLKRLFCCGFGSWPHQLVDLESSWKSVHVKDAQGMTRPLRLTRTEVGALMLALESLKQHAEVIDQHVVDSVLEKLAAIAGPTANAIHQLMEQETVVDSGIHQAIRDALRTNTQLEIVYPSSTGTGSQELKRLVSIVRVFSHKGTSYITAWDHSKQEHRTFKISRISQAQSTTYAATPNTAQLSFDPEDPFGFQNSTVQLELLVRKDCLWLAEDALMQIGDEVEPGWYRCVAPMVSDAWCIDFVLRNLERVRVLQPESLARTVCDKANRIIMQYDRGTDNV